eukprot:gene17656-19412_t
MAMVTRMAFALTAAILWGMLIVIAQPRRLPEISGTDIENSQFCNTLPFKMTIRKKGCMKTTIWNNVCSGSCLSVYIPQYKRAPLELCNLCQQKEHANVTIKLLCKRSGERVEVEETVSVVKSCGCKLQRSPCRVCDATTMNCAQ